MSNPASRKPAPHLVVLRVKRKRGDAAVESLLVAPDERGSNGEDQGFPDRKRRAACGAVSIEETLAYLNLDKTADQPHTHQQHNNMMQPPKRLFYKRVRTTEPDGSSNDDRRMKEKRPAPFATVAPPPPNHAALGGDAPVPTVGGGGMPSGGGGRLDALLNSRAANSPAFVSPPPRPVAVMDFMEVRRVKARAVGNARATSTNAGGSPGRGGCEQQQQPTKPSTEVASTVGPGTATADFHVIDLQAVGLRDNADMDVSSGVDRKEGEPVRGRAAAKRTAAPILTPVERQMDEAIFTVSRFSPYCCLREFRSHVGDECWRLLPSKVHFAVQNNLCAWYAWLSCPSLGGCSMPKQTDVFSIPRLSAQATAVSVFFFETLRHISHRW